ncbi:MAG: hypothetical protein IJQ89_02400 [Bacteroidales bacterium]|nr:hypothetical protein [Bacteroidales bacterium]
MGEKKLSKKGKKTEDKKNNRRNELRKKDVKDDIINILLLMSNYTPKTKFGDYFSFYYKCFIVVFMLFIVFYFSSIIPFDRDAAVGW